MRRDCNKFKNELVILHWSDEGGPEEDEIVNNSLCAFEAANPGARAHIELRVMLAKAVGNKRLKRNIFVANKSL